VALCSLFVPKDFVYALICYKQKCKVVSLNLAHPVYWNEYKYYRNSTTGFHVFCREITYKYYRITTIEDTTVANVL